VNFRGRQCLKDYAILRLDTRLPHSLDVFYDGLPTRQYLPELSWAEEATKIGFLQFGIPVKKRGRMSGVTYGNIAGIHAVLKSAGQAGIRREFWALPGLLSRSSYEFANRGDLGSLVWTADGQAVGVVIAGWASLSNEVRAIVPPGYLVGKNILFPRTEEGGINFKEMMAFVVARPLCPVQSFEMILEDLESDYELYVSY